MLLRTGALGFAAASAAGTPWTLLLVIVLLFATVVSLYGDFASGDSRAQDVDALRLVVLVAALAFAVAGVAVAVVAALTLELALVALAERKDLRSVLG